MTEEELKEYNKKTDIINDIAYVMWIIAISMILISLIKFVVV